MLGSIALIDFSHALRVQYHVREPDGGPTSAGERTLSQLSDWRRSFDHVVICLDSPVYWRKKVFPQYKSSREKDDGYNMLCRWTQERLAKDGYSVAAVPTFEADDLIASLAPRMRERAKRVVLVGGDKDMAQSVGDGIIIMAPLGRGEWEERDAEWVLNKYGVPPYDMALFQAITGDGSDDVPGIQGIGPKGAAKLITQFKTVEAMRIAAVEAFTASKQEGAKELSAFWKRFLEGSPKLPDWLTLTTMRTDVPLDVDALLKRQPIQPLVVTPENIEHGDAWEGPSREELDEERAMLDPEVVISGPQLEPTRLSLGVKSVYAEAKTEPPKAFASGPSAASANHSDAKRPGPKLPDVDDGTTAIVVDRPAPPSWALALQPASVREASILSKELFNSRHYMTLEHAPGLLSIILKGRELGIGAMAALEMFFLVKGRPFPSAKGKHYLALRDPNCVWFTVTSADETHATVKTKHREAGILEYTYTIERAQRAGYLTGGNSHNWKTMTQEMLEARAKSKGADRWYPGSTFGMPSAEEVQDGESDNDE